MIDENKVTPCSIMYIFNILLKAFGILNNKNIKLKFLCKQVQTVVQETPGITKISFLSHSLGGLIARYAIGQLYIPSHESNLLESQGNDESRRTNNNDAQPIKNARLHPENTLEATSNFHGTIAGLEPTNFITVATPHLGSRGSQQV